MYIRCIWQFYLCIHFRAIKYMNVYHFNSKSISISLFLLEQDNSFEIEQQPPLGDRKLSKYMNRLNA